MASAAFTALAQRAHHSPVLVVELILPNASGGGTTTIRLCDIWASQIQLRLGIDVWPLIIQAGGVSTSIDPGSVNTSRGVRSLKVRDVPNWPESFGAGGLAATGGSLFQRLFVAFPGWHRCQVNFLLGFDDATMTPLSTFDPLFTMQLEDVKGEGDDGVELILTDIYDIKGSAVPTAIGDQTLTTLVSAISTLFVPSDPNLWISGQDELPSPDWLAPVLVIEPDTGDEERILISRKDNFDRLVVVDNWIVRSEEFANASWTVPTGTVVRTDADQAGPWGPSNGSKIAGSTATLTIRQDSGLTAAAISCNFSLWAREDPAFPGATGFLQLTDAAGANVTTAAFTLTPYWKRYEVSATFPGGATGVVRTEFGYSSGGAKTFIVSQAQLANRTLRTFYAKTVATAGVSAGRGAFGTTAIAHSAGDVITERAYYRRQTTDADSAAEGLHPVWIVADLFNRARVPPSWSDPTLLLSRFQEEADYKSGSRFRRTLVDPQSCQDLIVEVCQQFMLSAWCDRNGFMKCRMDWRPRGPGNTFTTLTRDNDIHQRGDKATSFMVDSNKISQVNYARVAWDLRMDTDGKEKAGDRIEDFRELNISGDFQPTVVGTDFRSLAGQTIFSKWIYQAGEASALAGRILSRFRTGARKIMATVGFRHYLTLDVGDTVRITHPTLRSLVGTTAAAASPLFQVTKISYGAHAEDLVCEFLEARQSRIAHITPRALAHGGGGTFPDSYDAATVAQQDFYGFIGDTNNKVGAAMDEGYVIG